MVPPKTAVFSRVKEFEAGQASSNCFSIDCESDFYGDLPIGNRISLYVAPGIDDLKPAHVFNRIGRLGDGIFDGLLDTDFRGTRQFDCLVNMFVHGFLLIVCVMTL
jgi:hypothetical protein